MLKFIDDGAPKSVAVIKLPQIPIGTTFYARIIAGSKLRLMLRFYGGIVDLHNPNEAWVPGAGQEFHRLVQDFEVYDYRPVDIVGTVKEISR